MSLLGAQGISRVALQSHRQTSELLNLLTAIDGVEPLFEGPHFHEAGIRLDRAIGPVLDTLAAGQVLGGYDLSQDFPELGNALLVCATETKTTADLRAYADALQEIMNASNVRSA
jgi:glycine dehydrogenase subunit 1